MLEVAMGKEDDSQDVEISCAAWNPVVFRGGRVWFCWKHKALFKNQCKHLLGHLSVGSGDTKDGGSK